MNSIHRKCSSLRSSSDLALLTIKNQLLPKATKTASSYSQRNLQSSRGTLSTHSQNFNYSKATFPTNVRSQIQKNTIRSVSTHFLSLMHFASNAASFYCISLLAH
jgi:hypothetical protein